MERENRYLEYKQALTKTYLKTVSAFANYNDGIIIFGISDDGRILGMEDAKNVCLNIENQINDSIHPHPDFSLEIRENQTIVLSVMKGLNPPYRYNGKIYRRNDSATVEVDEIEEKRLILEGMNLSFEELPIKEKNLSFSYLKERLTQELNLNDFDEDVLKSLNLFDSKKGYNNAAMLFSDSNLFPGLDIAVFGNSINIIKKRIDLSGESILKQYDDALKLFEDEYIVEKIQDGFRRKKALVPLDAFREAIANSLVHRTWDIKAKTKVEMYPDRIVVSSPGGLLSGMSEEEYIQGRYSYLRNPIVANVFHRLGIIEAFATGIRRIKESYHDSYSRPVFSVSENAISVSLPIVEECELSVNEDKVLSSMKPNLLYTRKMLEEESGIAKDTLLRVLKSLLEKGLVEKRGNARQSSYRKI